MPIRPENLHLYPKNWKQIREQILVRADNRCEWCGAENYQPHPKTGSYVVLTVMHLDHTPENCDPENLKAACQLCHNRYDAPVRAAGIRQRRLAAIDSTHLNLFPKKMIDPI